MASPTSRTLQWFRSRGWIVQVVERYLPFARVRQDLFGCIDLIAVNGTIIGVQATSTGNVSARIKKSIAEPRLKNWLLAGGEFWVVGWGKRGKKGKRKQWTCKWVEITLEDL